MRYLKPTTSFLLIVILASAPILAESRPYAEVIDVYGKAEFLASGKAVWQKIELGIFLYSGDSIKTDKDASVEIAFDRKNKNIVSIKPNTHVVLKLGDQEKIELVDGEVFALVKELSPTSRFEIRTPTAICGARGTGWGGDADKDRTIVSGHEDDSYAKGINKDGTVMKDATVVRQGYKTVVERFKKPSTLTRLTDRDSARWNKWKSDLAGRIAGRRIIKERLTRDLGKIQRQKEKIEERRDEDRIRQREKDSGAGTSHSDRTTY